MLVARIFKQTLKLATVINILAINVDDFSKIMMPDLNKVGRVFPMVMFSILPYVEFGSIDYRKDAPH